MVSEPIDIGSRRELFVDDFLVEQIVGASLTIHRPAAREVAIVHDVPWEGNTCFYHTVFKDDDLYRMYYRGSHYTPEAGKLIHEVTCCAESDDGIEWRRPEVGLFEFQGSKKNNIVWQGPGAHDFAVCKDANPVCREDQKYKSLARGEGGLFAFASADGLRWDPMADDPVITEGAFDSQNLAFWDPERGCYVEFHRHFRMHGEEKVRDIMTCTSDDFLNWSDPQWLAYPGAPVEHLYTNQITPYHRAPHILLGFPKRFVPTRRKVDHKYPGVSDAVFMSSRDGVRFKRWGEAFIRPGLQPERWGNRNNMVAWGIMETGSSVPGTPSELSIYSIEGYYQGESCQMRRFTLRLDGFVSVQAPLSGGSVTTVPMVFDGSELSLNVSTSAAGGVQVELQEADGSAVPGHSLADGDEIYGDEIDHTVSWKDGSDLSRLAGRPIRLHLRLRDADVWAFQFR